MNSHHVPSSKRTLIGTGSSVPQVVRRPRPAGSTMIGGVAAIHVTHLHLPEPAQHTEPPISLPVEGYDYALIGAVVAVASLGFMALVMLWQFV